MKLKIFFFLSAILLFSPLYAAPTIGLSLSGGGALGLAHIGVLKVMERAGLQPDYITGTSMGSLVGGLYASGYSALEMEQIVLSIDWPAVLNDKVDRSWKSMIEKEYDSKFIISLPMDGLDVQIPGGMILGNNVSLLLSRLLAHTSSVKHFDDLPIPFRCVATDLETGEAFVFEDGKLADAMRASMSIPSIFSPVENRGRVLADGMIARNFPVSDVKDMGADIIIGVDVMAEPMTREQFTNIGQVFNQSLALYSLPVNKLQRELCDYLILPDLGSYSTLSYMNAAEIIALGEQAAENYLVNFQLLAELKGQKQLSVQTEKPDHFAINRVEFNGLKDIKPASLLSMMSLHTPGEFSTEDIEFAVRRIYGTGFFDIVTWKLIDRKEGYILRLSVKELPAIALKAGLFWDNQIDSGLLWGLNFKNRFIEGTYSMLEGRLSENPYVNLSFFYQYGQLFGSILRTDLWFNNYSEIKIENDSDSALFNLRTYGARSSLGFYLSNSFNFGIGAEKEFYSVAIDNNDREITDFFTLNAFLNIDTVNRTFFPTSGTFLELENKVYTPWLSVGDYDQEQIFSRSYVNWKQFFNLPGPFSLAFQSQAGRYLFSDGLAVQSFIIGGYSGFLNQSIPFQGYEFAEIISDTMILGSARFQWEVQNNIFLSIIGNGGKVNDALDSSEIIWSSSLELGLQTPLGALVVSPVVGNGKNTFSFYMGFGSGAF